MVRVAQAPHITWMRRVMHPRSVEMLGKLGRQALIDEQF
jgi:hypothetical protein